MSERLGSLAWMGGIVLLLALIYWPDDDTLNDTRPVSEDRRAAGLAALVQWARASNIGTAALRERYSALADFDRGDTGNILIAHAPMRLTPESDELADLTTWVRAGNTLVVSAALFETPAWMFTGSSVISTTRALSGLSLSESHIAPEDEDGTDDASILDAAAWVAASGSARTVELVTVQNHPLGQGFVDVTVPWDGTRIVHASNSERECTGGGATEADDPTLAHDGWTAAVAHGASGQTAIWERAVGAGRVIVLGHPSLLANAAINEHGNKRFAMNLIAAHLGPNGQLLFDDAHQGESDLYTPSDLLSDIRVLQTLGFLLVCWAVYVLADAGSWERATRRETLPTSGQAALVRASGDYLARRLRSTALAEGLLAPLRERLAGKWQLPMDRALIDGLEREGIDATTRRDLVQRLATNANKGMNAVKLHNLILALRREVR